MRLLLQQDPSSNGGHVPTDMGVCLCSKCSNKHTQGLRGCGSDQATGGTAQYMPATCYTCCEDLLCKLKQDVSAVCQFPEEDGPVVAARAHNGLLGVEHHLVHAALVAGECILHCARRCGCSTGRQQQEHVSKRLRD